MTAAKTNQSAYVPGVCNINRAEIAQRQKVGYIGSLILVGLLLVLILLSVSRWLRLILFIPAFVAAIGFLQARNHFCVGYGAAGMQNAAEGSSQSQAVSDITAQQADKRRARQLNLQAAAIAIVITLITLVIPHI